MRFAVLAAAVAALWVQPVRAADIVNFEIFAFVEGTRYTNTCSADAVPTCNLTASPFSQWISAFTAYPLSAFDDGSEVFNYGHHRVDGAIRGTINYLGGGLFTGTDLSFAREDSNYRTCGSAVSPPNCTARHDIGTAPTFRVVATSGVVPEPTTWALMLAGFAAIGAAMRQRRHVPSLRSS